MGIEQIELLGTFIALKQTLIAHISPKSVEMVERVDDVIKELEKTTVDAIMLNDRLNRLEQKIRENEK